MRPHRFPPPARASEPAARPSSLIPWISLLFVGLLAAGAQAQTYNAIEDAPTITPPAATELAFSVRIDSDVNNAANADDGQKVVVDDVGNAYVAGSLVGVTTDRDFIVLSVTRNKGVERWTTVIDGGVAGTDRADALVLDSNGDVYAAGRFVVSGSSPDFAVVKLDGATGSALWPSPFTLDGGVDLADRATAVVVAANGDPIAGGESNTAAGGQDMLVCRLAAADGAQKWCTALDGTETTEVDGDELSALVLDDIGDVIVVGAFENSTTGVDLSVVKLRGSTGAEVWRIDLDGLNAGGLPGNNGLDFGNDIAFDGSGAVFVVGYAENLNTGFDLTVAKLLTPDLISPPGPRLVWRQDIDGNPLTGIDGGDLGTTITVDANGDVFAGGSLVDDATGRRFLTVVKLDGADFTAQRVLWTTNVDGTAIVADTAIALDIATDSNGDAIAVGIIENDGTNEDMAIVKFDGRSDTMAGGGTEMYRVEYIGMNTTGGDVANGVAIDSLDGILATGALRQPQTGGRDVDIAVVKIPEPTGVALQLVALASLAALANRRQRQG